MWIGNLALRHFIPPYITETWYAKWNYNIPFPAAESLVSRSFRLVSKKGGRLWMEWWGAGGVKESRAGCLHCLSWPRSRHSQREVSACWTFSARGHPHPLWWAQASSTYRHTAEVNQPVTNTQTQPSPDEWPEGSLTVPYKCVSAATISRLTES